MMFSTILLLSCARSNCAIDRTSAETASDPPTGEIRVGEQQPRKDTAFVKKSSVVHYEIVTNLNANGTFYSSYI